MNRPLAIVLINARLDREAVVEALQAAGATVEAFATADRAMPALESHAAAVIVIDARVYPGFGCSDPSIREMTGMLRDARCSENLLRWQIAMSVMEGVREKGSPNVLTRCVIRFPPLPAYHFVVGDELTREGVEEDLARLRPVVACHGADLDACVEAAVAALREAAAEGALGQRNSGGGE
jgi:hypothetical protein